MNVGDKIPLVLKSEFESVRTTVDDLNTTVNDTTTGLSVRVGNLEAGDGMTLQPVIDYVANKAYKKGALVTDGVFTYRAAADISSTNASSPIPIGPHRFSHVDTTWDTPPEPAIHNFANSYKAGDRAYINEYEIKANGDIPANTAFAWGTAGATWKPVLYHAGHTWKGVFNAAVSYSRHDVVSSTNTSALYVSSIGAQAQISGASYNPNNGSNRSVWRPFGRVVNPVLRGAVSGMDGQEGVVPAPKFADKDKFLKGDATWSSQLKEISGGIEVSGGTKLGTDAPAIKTKILTGSTPSSQGGFAIQTHDLTASKILSLSALAQVSDDLIPAGYVFSSGFQFNLKVMGNVIFIGNSSSNSSNILNKPLKIFITYEA